MLIERSYRVNHLKQSHAARPTTPLALLLLFVASHIDSSEPPQTKRKSIHGPPENRKDKATRNRYRAEGRRRGRGGVRSLSFISEFDEQQQQKKKENHLTRTVIDALPLTTTRRKWLDQNCPLQAAHANIL